MFRTKWANLRNMLQNTILDVTSVFFLCFLSNLTPHVPCINCIYIYGLIKSFTAGSGQVIEQSKKQPMHKVMLQRLVCHICSAKLSWATSPVQNDSCAQSTKVA